MSPTPPEGTGHDRATTAPRKPKLILMTAPVSCPPRGNRRVARSGAEWRGDLLFPQGWGVVQKMYFVWAEAPEFCRPFPLVGGGRSKKCIWGWGGAGFCRPLPPGVGVVHQVYFWGWHQIFRLQPPPASGGVVQTSVLGGAGAPGFDRPYPQGEQEISAPLRAIPD